MTQNSIAILDFGSQYAQLIARRVREAHVYCELFPWDTPAPQVLALQPKGFILSGGPASVYAEGAPTLPPYVLGSGLPVLGLCYGMQLLTYALGGQVDPAPQREYGPATGRDPDPQFLAAFFIFSCLDVARRPHHATAGGVRRPGPLGQQPAGRHGRPAAQLLRPAVPPGGEAHPRRSRDPAPFRDRDLRGRSPTGRPSRSSSRACGTSGSRSEGNASWRR